MCLLWLRFREYAMLMAEKVNGWPDNVYAPSAVRYNEKLPQPKEMSKGDIEHFKEAWVAGVKRALAFGFSVIEIWSCEVKGLIDMVLVVSFSIRFSPLLVTGEWMSTVEALRTGHALLARSLI